MLKLAGKVALVTGASRGIGRSIAHRLAEEGATVAVHYAGNRSAAEEAVSQIEAGGGTAFAVEGDYRSLEGVRASYDAFSRKLKEVTNEEQFDILVNNAGIGQMSTVEDIAEEAFDEIVNIHVKAPLFLIQRALPDMKNGGRIINLSSAVTRIASPNLIAYSISKGAVNTMTLALAQQLGPRQITVNAIMPGFIDTDMNAALLQNEEGRQFAAGLSTFMRIGQPEDVADIAAFLASDDSRWVTGQLIDASGGTQL